MKLFANTDVCPLERWVNSPFSLSFLFFFFSFWFPAFFLILWFSSICQSPM